MNNKSIYIIGDVVKYDNKIMVIKEPRDGSHFDLFSTKEGLVYCLVDVDEIKTVALTPAILEDNGWEKLDNAFGFPSYNHTEAEWLNLCLEPDGWRAYSLNVVVKEFEFVHQLQHLLFGLGLDNILKV